MNKQSASTVKRVFALSALALLLHIAPGFAQGHDGQIGLNFQLGFPQGDFGKNIDNVGIGFGVDALWMPSAFGVGLSVNYLIYGSDTRKVPFNQWAQEVTVDVTTTNSILLGHVLFRLEYPSGPVRPYIDVLAGLNYLATSTEIEDEQSIDENRIAGSTNSEDVAFSYGAGGGLQFKVYEHDTEDEFAQVMVDLGVRYLFGGNARYLKEGAIESTTSGVSYHYSESKTDIITGRLGVVVRF